MLRMSKLTDYGTVIVSAMARDPDAIHSVSRVAAATAAATPTEAKVMKTLARGGVVKASDHDPVLCAAEHKTESWSEANWVAPETVLSYDSGKPPVADLSQSSPCAGA